METGELAEEDVARVSQEHIPPPLRVSQEHVPPLSQGPASLPPMVGGNETMGPPLQRMVLGDSLPPGPGHHSLPPDHQRLVEGDNDDIEIVNVQLPPLPSLPSC